MSCFILLLWRAVFASSAESYSSELRRATVEEREKLKSWLERKVYADTYLYLLPILIICTYYLLTIYTYYLYFLPVRESWLGRKAYAGGMS